MLKRIKYFNHILSQLEKHLLPVILFASIVWAWRNQFMQDDAFISFRYAQNLAEGYGLTWNIGEPPIEGYTNFLWTFILVIPHYMHWDPISFSKLVGITCLVGSLYLSYRTALLILEQRANSFVIVALLGANHTFSAFATGGLETSLHVLLITLSTLLTLRLITNHNYPAKQLVTFSLVSALTILTRIDSILIIGILCCVIVYRLSRCKKSTFGGKVIKFGFLLVPIAIILDLWLWWKLFFYGDILPNTFYVKALVSHIPIVGGYFIASFLTSYFLLLVPFLPFIFINKFRKLVNLPVAVLSTITIVWLSYLYIVGGDFMEFRLITPVLPFIYILSLWLITNLITNRSFQFLLIAMLFSGIVHHEVRFVNGDRTFHSGIPSTWMLDKLIMDYPIAWEKIGTVLGKSFRFNQKDITIATTAAGVIPYYSKLRTVDLLGLNDKWIAKNGKSFDHMPGHRKIATLEYLITQRTDIIIGHPNVIDRHSKTKCTTE